LSRHPDHLSPAAIVEQQKQSKFVCSACGSGRDCDCNAPARERLAEVKELARQRKIKQREKAEPNQQSRHVTHEDDHDPRPAPGSSSDPLKPSLDALEEAVALKGRILQLLPQMTDIAREQFWRVLLQEIKAIITGD
jgi:hypothetical protein